MLVERHLKRSGHHAGLSTAERAEAVAAADVWFDDKAIKALL